MQNVLVPNSVLSYTEYIQFKEAQSMVLAGTEIHILNMTRAYCYTLQKRRYPLVLGVKLVW